jgi:hemoglobin
MRSSSAHTGGVNQTIFDAAGGYDALRNLAETWHEHCVRDPLTTHPFGMPGLHPQHTERLAAYLSEALGGPTLYSDTMGDETYVQTLHAGEGAHRELDQRALELFDETLVEVAIPEPARSAISEYFHWGTHRMDAYAESKDLVPNDLEIPHWSWDGPMHERD